MARASPLEDEVQCCRCGEAEVRLRCDLGEAGGGTGARLAWCLVPGAGLVQESILTSPHSGSTVFSLQTGGVASFPPPVVSRLSTLCRPGVSCSPPQLGSSAQHCRKTPALAVRPPLQHRQHTTTHLRHLDIYTYRYTIVT